jgi:hypothetical protein
VNTQSTTANSATCAAVSSMADHWTPERSTLDQREHRIRCVLAPSTSARESDNSTGLLTDEVRACALHGPLGDSHLLRAGGEMPRASRTPIGLSEIVDNISFQQANAPVPEPATLVTLACGLAVLGARRWRLRKAQPPDSPPHPPSIAESVQRSRRDVLS